MYEMQGAGEGGVVSWVLTIVFLTPFGDAEFQTRAYPSLEGCLQGGAETVSEFSEQIAAISIISGSPFKVECQDG